jgi:very-short-patch-repair endonuclease
MTSKNRPRELPYNPHLKEREQKNYEANPPRLKKFWHSLRKIPFYETTVFNRQKPIGNYIVDFFYHQFHIVIDIDGDSHGPALAQSNNSERTEFLESLGLTVLRFTNREVDGYVEAVMMKVETFIANGKGTPPPSPHRRRGSFYRTRVKNRALKPDTWSRPVKSPITLNTG